MWINIKTKLKLIFVITLCQLSVENVYLKKEHVLKKACRKSSENMDKQALC